MNPEEVAEAFTKLKDEGKVLNFGVSNFKPSQFNMLSSYLEFPLITNQIEISVMNLDSFVNGSIDHLLERGIPPMAWSPLAGGKIFSSNDDRAVRLRGTLERIAAELNISSIDTLMYAWLLNHPAKIIPIVGSGKIDRIKAAVEAENVKLTRQQWFEIWQSSTGREVE
jgi:predicted oxidoreductase